jgi:hypothetical protein
MTKQETVQALKEIHPLLCDRRDFEFTAEGALVWKPATLAHGFAQPTEAALEAAQAVVKDRQRLSEFTPVSRGQLRQALHLAGLLAGVETAMNAAGNESLKIWWEDTTTMHRDNARLIGFANSLGLTVAQVDAIWETALKQKP